MWLRKSTLDRRIALGADLGESPELARARQLSSRRCRAGLAAGLRRMVEAAEEPRPLLTSQVPLNRRAIRAQRELFLEVASDLESPDELSPRGVALVERLLTDGALAVLRRGKRRGAARRAAPSPRRAPPRLNRMDLLSIVIALAAFGVLLLLIEGLDRV